MYEETVDYKGYTLTIVPDEYADSPRDWDNIGTMVCFHKRYSLGDKTDYKSADYNNWDELLAAVTEQEGPLISLPLYLYDHSGITIATAPFSCPWDSGQIGFIYVTSKKACAEWGWKTLTKKHREQVLEGLNSEVKVYDQYLTGDVYNISVDKGDEHIGSCGGYYGYEEALAAGKADVDAEIEHNKKVA